MKRKSVIAIIRIHVNIFQMKHNDLGKNLGMMPDDKRGNMNMNSWWLGVENLSDIGYGNRPEVKFEVSNSN